MPACLATTTLRHLPSALPHLLIYLADPTPAPLLGPLPRSDARMVFLSATLPNAYEFAQWVAYIHGAPCHVVYTDYRPTPLVHYAYPAGGSGLYLVRRGRRGGREGGARGCGLACRGRGGRLGAHEPRGAWTRGSTACQGVHDVYTERALRLLCWAKAGERAAAAAPRGQACGPAAPLHRGTAAPPVSPGGPLSWRSWLQRPCSHPPGCPPRLASGDGRARQLPGRQLCAAERFVWGARGRPGRRRRRRQAGAAAGRRRRPGR